MATRTREGHPGKGKTGSSPTLSRLTDPTTRRSPNPTPSRSVGSAGEKQETRSSEKHNPNYLKPTRSSSSGGHDHSPQHSGKKQASSSSDAANRANLMRRRSFDRPPAPQSPKTPISAANKPTLMRRRSLDMTSPSQVQKPRISPTPGERNRQSSSAHSTMISSPRGTSDRLSRVRKDAGEKQSLSPRTVSTRKSSRGTRKQDSGTSSMKKKAPIAASGDRIDYPDIVNIPLSEEEIPETLVTDEEVAIHAACNNEMPDKIVEVEDKELIDPILPEPDIQKHQNLYQTKSSAGKADKDAPSIDQLEEPENQTLLVEENTDSFLESYQHTAGKSSDSAKENIACEQKAHDQDKGAVEYANETSDKKETEGVENAAEDVKEQEAENVAAKQQLPVQAKRESAVSNDVIEETASKLREQRKNKVRALAGAFETVISLQESK